MILSNLVIINQADHINMDKDDASYQFVLNTTERYARAQSRPFSGGLADLFIFSGAEERPPLTDEESPLFQGGVLQIHCFPRESVSAILTDIEGTTTSLSFVQDVLFPYAKKNVRQYLQEHQQEPSTVQVIEEVKSISSAPEADLEQVIAILLSWMQQDKKITPLKTLQGMMWEEGYQQQAFQGHVYEDAFYQLCRWQEEGIPLYVYSSGSVRAQELLFSHSIFGDIRFLFSAHFDTKIGSKKESSSYLSIAQKIGLHPDAILFLSDSIDELKAAQEAGMQVLLLCREEVPDVCLYPHVKSFDKIKFN